MLAVAVIWEWCEDMLLAERLWHLPWSWVGDGGWCSSCTQCQKIYLHLEDLDSPNGGVNTIYSA